MNVCPRRLRLTIATLFLLSTAPLFAQQDPNLSRGQPLESSFGYDGIDNINLLNGNVSITIPVGSSFPVGGTFAYGLNLVYNSKVWDYSERFGPSQTYSVARPGASFNAGLGWRLSLGSLAAQAPLPGQPAAGTYTGADGAEHKFYPTLHAGEAQAAGVAYTRDGSYIRLTHLGSGFHLVEFSDGSIQRFDNLNRLYQMSDRWANYVDVTYPDALTWKLTDAHGRNQFIYFRTATYDNLTINVVDRVVLTAFNGGTATYTFTYTQSTVSRGCRDTDPNTPAAASLPMLTRIALPDGSAFVPAYYTDNADLSCRQGSIQSIQLPTLGKYEYAYREYVLPTEGCTYRAWARRSPGVATRKVIDAAGTVLGTWTYSQTLSQPPTPGFCDDGTFGAPSEEVATTVVTPSLDKTVNYFSVWPNTPASPNGFQAREYGLPFTRRLADATGSRYLSTETFDCDAAGANCVLKRTSYVRYESEATSCIPFDSGCTDGNRRLVSQRMLYNDDGNRFADVDYSNFDGLGHYRQSTTNGNFSAGNVRTHVTNYNPTVGTLNLDANGNPLPGFTMLAPSFPWLLYTYDEQTVSEGSATAKSQFCFVGLNGALVRQRVLNGSTPGVNDVIIAYLHDANGNVTREEYFGADVQTVPTGSLCSLTLPANRYRADNTYSAGVLNSSQWVNGSGVALSFKKVDRDIDLNTGLVKVSRDIAGIATTFEYDLMGRPTWIMPELGHGGWTENVYTIATTPTALASVLTRERANGSKAAQVLANGQLLFDAFGRVWQQQNLLPDGTWSVVETLYDAMGRKSSVSEPQAGGTTKKTLFLEYDPFGRPSRIRPADGSGHDVTTAYFGVRAVTRSVKVGTSRNVSGAIVETSAVTTHIFDRQGRLWRVNEPSGVGGATVPSTYTYDIGNRLTQAQTVATVNSVSVTQNRFWTYDNRGFLRSETQPERGVSGNGSVVYGSYDPLGKAGTRRQGAAGGAFDLTFSYDRAGRMVQVRETGGLQRVLKEYVYSSGNSASNWSNGKIIQAKRHNYHERFSIDVLVVEAYTYGGRDGRPSQRDTSVSTGEAFTTSAVYNPLGQISSQTYPQCTHAGCSAAVPARSQSFTYTRGYLTAVPGFATSISYHANGLYNQVVRANGVTDTQANDPNAMLRPGSIGFAGTSVSWNTGAFQYDGAGNVVKMGSDYFLYDPVQRLTTGTAFAAGNKLQDYGYDAFGNLNAITTTVNGTPTARSITTVASTNRLSSVGYDDAGNQTSWGLYGYAFDAFSNLKSLSGGGNDVVYIYTADDERLWSYNLTANRSSWRLRNFDGQVLREFINDGSSGSNVWSLGRDFIYRGASLLATVTPAGTFHHHLDHLGSPRLVTNASGLQVTQLHSYPFGEEASTPAADAGPMRFTGHERDANAAGTGDDLDYMHARYYNPLLARFLSFDPLGGNPSAPQSWNRYAYVKNNPVGHIDPFGLVDENPTATFYASITVTASGLSSIDRWVIDRLYSGYFAVRDFAKTLSYIDGSDFSFGRAAKLSGQGFAAYVDGFIPFVDPLESVGLYDEGEVGMTSMQWVGVGASVVVSTGGAAAKLAAKGATQAVEGGTVVYQSVNASGSVQYVGITNNLARRAAEHLRSKGIQVAQVRGLGSLSRIDARAVEQALINVHGLAKNGGTLLNKINSISSANPNYGALVDRGIQLLSKAGYL